jgi:hypothetical protein
MRLIFLSILLTFTAFSAEKSYESFLVKVGEEKVSVITPKTKNQVVTIIIENKTFERIISEIRTDKKVLKRFTLEPEGSRGANFSVTVDFSKLNKLFYVSISPPFQAVPLELKGKNYEIP